jgi:hypothetical protein
MQFVVLIGNRPTPPGTLSGKFGDLLSFITLCCGRNMSYLTQNKNAPAERGIRCVQVTELLDF